MHIFTDGACIANGRKNSRASFAAYFINTNNIENIDNNEKFVIRGMVQPYEYIINEKNDLKTTTINCSPSNNRGELLAIISAFMFIIKNKNLFDKITLYSDSLICVKTINEWYYKRLKKGTTHEFKNYDLIKIMMDLYESIRGIICIEIKHVRSHQKINSKMTNEQKNIITSNSIVDNYCTELLINKLDNITYETITLLRTTIA